MLLTVSVDVVLLHGWPGLHSDFDAVRERLEGTRTVLAPDLAGFGASFVPGVELDAGADAHAQRVIDLIEWQRLRRPVVVGYDIGSRVAQAVARKAPDLIAGIVVTPGYPGIAERARAAEIQPEYWYQHFHRLPLAAALLDGDRRAIHTYLAHFWRAWSARDDLAAGARFEQIVDAYARPGAFAASIAWYAANTSYSASAQIVVPSIVLWAAHDPLFRLEWADRLGESFADFRLELLPDCGHFVPLEAPDAVVRAIELLAPEPPGAQ
jgi:pimeloyl-ACP methyl ester carboxylesterase